MVIYERRFYRESMKVPDLVSFVVQVKESDLFILADKDLSVKALSRLKKERENLEAFIRYNPLFQRSLVPVEVPSFAPRICRFMAEAAQKAGVGPMAAVAGAVNEMVAETLLDETQELIIENGGDLLVVSQKERMVAIYAGEDSPFSFRVGIRLRRGKMWGVATSSGKVGPSLSFGEADAVVVVSPSSALSDAWATSLANRVEKREDVEKVLKFAHGIPGITGVVIIMEDFLGVEGDIILEHL